MTLENKLLTKKVNSADTHWESETGMAVQAGVSTLRWKINATVCSQSLKEILKKTVDF